MYALQRCTFPRKIEVREAQAALNLKDCEAESSPSIEMGPNLARHVPESSCIASSSSEDSKRHPFLFNGRQQLQVVLLEKHFHLSAPSMTFPSAHGGSSCAYDPT
jgi:hypothetical protein